MARGNRSPPTGVRSSSARQGARTAVYLENSNAEVLAAVQNSLANAMGLDPASVTVRISKLDSTGNEEYQVMNLNENEQGEAVRVMATVNYGDIGFASNMLGLMGGTLSSYAVMRRQE